jgi:RES domain-containing protein
VFERKHQASAFSGEGARLYRGRWNSVGTPVIYTSSSFSLALLEIMVNTSSVGIPSNMAYARVDVPGDLRLEVVDIAVLPTNWFDFPAPPECQTIGDSWVKRGETVGLVVPSAVARIETNTLLNAAHPEFERLTLGKIDAVAVDHGIYESLNLGSNAKNEV